MSAEKKKQMGVLGLIVSLVVVLFGGVLFVGAVSGWFDNTKVSLDAEYVCKGDCGERIMPLTVDEYEGLVKAKKSFIVFVDQDGCTTADRLREYVTNYAAEVGIKVYRMMFAEVKGMTLGEKVKYYPSVALVSKGEVVGWLRADADEDAAAYNDYGAFKEWMGKYLR